LPCGVLCILVLMLFSCLQTGLPRCGAIEVWRAPLAAPTLYHVQVHSLWCWCHAESTNQRTKQLEHGVARHPRRRQQ
jgi:hypothetical protein